MTAKLHLGDDLALPLDAVSETFAIIAMRGAGKTNAARVLAEEMFAAVVALEKQLAQLTALRVTPPVVMKPVAPPFVAGPFREVLRTLQGLTDRMESERTLVRMAAATLEGSIDGAVKAAGKVYERNGVAEHPRIDRGVSRILVKEQTVPALNGIYTGPLGKGQRTVLCAIAQQDPEGTNTTQLSVLTGYKRSTRDQHLKELRRIGAIEGAGERIVATAAGMAVLGDAFSPLPTGAPLREHWLERLPAGEGRILRLALSAYPEAISAEDITAATEFQRSTRDQYLKQLRARKLVERTGPGAYRASDTLFDHEGG